MQSTPDFARLPQSIRTPSFPYGHCQGIAVDTERGCVYYSFTTALVKTDLSGNFLGSAVGLLGHLGCIVRNDADGLIYGSLEYKNDAIGKGILKRAAVSEAVENGFYIAVFDGDKIVRAEMDAEEDGIMTAAFLKPVTDDYLGTAETERRTYSAAPASTARQSDQCQVILHKIRSCGCLSPTVSIPM